VRTWITWGSVATLAVAGLWLQATFAFEVPIQGAPSGSTQAATPALAVTLAVEHPAILEPFPARITLQLHNTTPGAVWLFRHVRDPQDIAEGQSRLVAAREQAKKWTTGGSSLVVHLVPVAAASGRGTTQAAVPAWAQPPHGRVLASVGMPHPRLVRLGPGGTETEGAVIELDPGLVASQGHDEPVWGRYRLSVSYNASYSNGDALSRDLGVAIWADEAISNEVEVDLEPSPASAAGSVSGRIANEDGRSLGGILVSLSDGADHIVAQMTTDDDGAYSFRGLPWGLYWVTARRLRALVETAIFDHVNLSAEAPSGTINLVVLEPEIYEPKQKLHKPVLLRVTNSQGQALAGVALDALWSSGDVADNVKGETTDDGTAALDLIPGRNYVTLKRRKCKNQESRVDVADGDGIDGLSLQFDCAP
jgi:hypothetical protein